MITRRAFIASAGLLIPTATFGDDAYKPTGRYAERTPRVIFFHCPSCVPCRVALGPDGFPQWLAEAGWDIGHDARSHVQLIDVDEHPEIADQYGVSTVPAIVLVDGTKRKAVAYRDRQSIVDLLNPPAVSKRMVTVGVHSHRCSHCGYTWSHRDGDPGATHVCAKCGRQQLVIDRHWTQAVEVASPVGKPVGVPVFRSGKADCPHCRRGG